MSRRRDRTLLVGAGLIGSVALAMSATDTLSAFTAAITNTTNTVSTPSYAMTETNAARDVTCSSSSGADGTASCSTINKYGGGTLRPGDTATTTVRITNAGSATPSTFTLTGGACSQSGTAPATTTATDLCSKITVTVYPAGTATGTPVFTGTLTQFQNKGAIGLTAPAPGATQDMTFAVSLDGGVGNTYQNLTASQPMTWTFS